MRLAKTQVAEVDWPSANRRRAPRGTRTRFHESPKPTRGCAALADRTKRSRPSEDYLRALSALGLPRPLAGSCQRSMDVISALGADYASMKLVGLYQRGRLPAARYSASICGRRIVANVTTAAQHYGCRSAPLFSLSDQVAGCHTGDPAGGLARRQTASSKRSRRSLPFHWARRIVTALFGPVVWLLAALSFVAKRASGAFADFLAAQSSTLIGSKSIQRGDSSQRFGSVPAPFSGINDSSVPHRGLNRSARGPPPAPAPRASYPSRQGRKLLNASCSCKRDRIPPVHHLS